MAEIKDRKMLFASTRTRVILLFTVLVVTIAIILGLISLHNSNVDIASTANLNTVPGNIASIPGSLDQTIQYANLQQQQNIAQAVVAEKTGTSAIPTIIRSQAFGVGENIGPQHGNGGLDFTALSRNNNTPSSNNAWLDSLKRSGCSLDSVHLAMDQGATPVDLKQACSCEQLTAAKYSLSSLREICSCAELRPLGVSIQEFKNSGWDATQLRACGFTACQERGAGFSANDMKKAGYTNGELKGAGFPESEIQDADGLPAGITADDVRKNGCNAAALIQEREKGVSAAAIKRISGCSAKELMAAGYTPNDLMNAGYPAADLRALGLSPEALKKAGYTAQQLRAAGYPAKELQAAGYTAKQLQAAGYPAKDLREAGYTAQQLKNAGYPANELKDAGYNAKQLHDAGFTAKQLRAAGYPDDQVQNAGYTAAQLHDAGLNPGANPLSTAGQASGLAASIPSNGLNPNDSVEQAKIANNKKLAEAVARQHAQMIDQKYQQAIQQRTTTMLSSATQFLQSWKVVAKQQYEQTTIEKNKVTDHTGTETYTSTASSIIHKETAALIEIGDVLFAVVDTAVNSDEAGPILATIVSGPLTGAKLIGSFTLPPNADKMVISFNTLSVPGAAGSISIHAFAIDPNTARTALSSETNHHYLTRYSALFASTFLEGFGNAFQSADTTITIGGTGGTTDTTVSNGIGRSAMENAVIGLATVGKAWGQVAQQGMSRPTTVQVYSGTGIGVLFTQDVKAI